MTRSGTGRAIVIRNNRRLPILLVAICSMDAAGARHVGARVLGEVEEGSLEEVRICFYFFF